MVIDQLASATLPNGSNWVNCLLDEKKKSVIVAEGAGETALMKLAIYKGRIDECG